MTDETPIHHQEMPPVTDPAILSAGLEVGRIRSAIVAVLPPLVGRGRGETSGPIVGMVVGVLFRMAEASLSAELLLSKGRWRDAAILVLTLTELRLDLQYVAADPQRASTWLSHREMGRKPWKVANQIRNLIPEGRERDAEKKNYETFSMIKHGNPASRGLGFAAHPEGPTLALYGDDPPPGMRLACLSALGTNLLDATAAADGLLRTVGQGLGEAVENARRHYEVLQKIHSDHLTEELRRLFVQGAL